MAVSLRERPVLRGKDAERFLSEEKRVDECRARLSKGKGQDAEPIPVRNKKTVRLCLTE